MKYFFIGLLFCISSIGFCVQSSSLIYSHPSQTIERGRHVLIRVKGYNIQDSQIILTYTPDNKTIPIERVITITQDTFIFMVPYNAPDGNYVLTVIEDARPTVHHVEFLDIQGDLGQHGYNWECGLKTGPVVPNCAEPGEIIDSTPPTVELLDPNFLDDSGVASPLGELIPIGGSKAFVGGLETLKDGLNFRIPCNPNDTFTSISCMNPTQYVPNGINEFFVITSSGVQRGLINLLSTDPAQADNDAVDRNSFVVTFFPNEEKPEQLDLNSLPNLQDFNLIETYPLGGTEGVCGGTLTLWESTSGSPSDPILGHLLQTLREQLDAQFSVNYVVDPNPNTNYCQDPSLSTTPYQDLIQLDGNLTGTDITIAILDTGFTQPDLAPDLPTTVIQEFGTSLSRIVDLSNLTSQDFLDPSNNTHDFLLRDDLDGDMQPDIASKINVGHGTGVAVLAAGQTLGVASGANVLPLRVCDERGICKGSNMIKGICYALNYAKTTNEDPEKSLPLVINMSIGGPIPMKALQDAVSQATSSDAVVVASGGNDGWPECKLPGDCQPASTTPVTKSAVCSSGQCTPGLTVPSGNRLDNYVINNQPHYPAAYSYNIPGLASVAAIVDNTEVRYYSNKGSYITLTAPDNTLLFGANLTGDPSFTSPTPINLPDGFYRGTSFTAPLTAGAAARIKEQFPFLSSAGVVDCLIQAAMNNPNNSPTISNPPTPNDLLNFGVGILNVGYNCDPQN